MIAEGEAAARIFSHFEIQYHGETDLTRRLWTRLSGLFNPTGLIGEE
jgi:hypothetical protein